MPNNNGNNGNNGNGNGNGNGGSGRGALRRSGVATKTTQQKEKTNVKETPPSTGGNNNNQNNNNMSANVIKISAKVPVEYEGKLKGTETPKLPGLWVSSVDIPNFISGAYNPISVWVSNENLANAQQVARSWISQKMPGSVFQYPLENTEIVPTGETTDLPEAQAGTPWGKYAAYAIGLAFLGFGGYTVYNIASKNKRNA